MCEYINDAIIQEDFKMEKTLYDESNGLWYELQSDYYIPCRLLLKCHTVSIRKMSRKNVLFIVTILSLRGIIMSL